MKLLFSIPLEDCEQPYYDPGSTYSGVLLAHQDQYVYCRGTFIDHEETRGDFMKTYRFSKDGQSLTSSLHPLPDDRELGYLWRVYETQKGSMICVGRDDCFDLTQKTFHPMDDELLSFYLADTHLDNEYHFTDDSFSFPPYEISHVGSLGYECRKNGELMYKFKTQGYLYTDIQKYNDTIVFGTSGAGGHFLALNLENGNVIFDVNTKGTEHFLFDGQRFYAYMSNKGGHLLSVDLQGNLETVPIPGVTYAGCPLRMIDNVILCLSFGKKGDKHTTAYINAVSIP